MKIVRYEELLHILREKGISIAPAGAARVKGYDFETCQKLAKQAEHFNPKTGFLQEYSGYLLPWELRSPTCLYTYCSGDMMTKEDKELLLRIRYGAEWS